MKMVFSINSQCRDAGYVEYKWYSTVITMIIIHLQLLRRTEKRVKLLLGHICLSLHVIIIIYQDYCLQQRRAPHLVDEPSYCIQVRAGDALEVD